MTKLALFVRLEAKPGQEAALADFLASALPLANAESGTTAWFALKFGPSTFGVFDAFADEAGRAATHFQVPELIADPKESTHACITAVTAPAVDPQRLPNRAAAARLRP